VTLPQISHRNSCKVVMPLSSGLHIILLLCGMLRKPQLELPPQRVVFEEPRRSCLRASCAKVMEYDSAILESLIELAAEGERAWSWLKWSQAFRSGL
jgi:hypothetical protein